MKTSGKLVVFELAMALVLVCGAFGLAVWGTAALTAASTTPVVTPTLSGEALCGQQINLRPDLPPEKLRLQQLRYQDCVQSYNTRLTPKPMPPAVQTMLVPRAWNFPTAVVPRTPAGAGTILDVPGEATFGPDYAIENSWVFETQDKKYIVFAGARREEGNPQPKSAMQGIVSVRVWTSNGDFLPEGGMFNVPVKNGGAVKIVGAQGQRLILKTDNGTTFYFDLPTRQFVSGSVATVTPPATPTGRAYPSP